MGCDIHLYREKHVDGKWVSADKWTTHEYGNEVEWDDRSYAGRNYNLFGALSRGVRSEHDFSFEPRGLPLLMSPEVAQVIQDWDGDGHSHSYLYLHEVKELLQHLESNTIKISGMKNRDELAALRASIESGAPDWNLLFPYCAMTNDPKQVGFEIDVPASFYMGVALKKIIDSFDGIDGDNHRIVFFFDN